MFSNTRTPYDFLRVKFYEHPIVDYLNKRVKLFDVTAEGYLDSPSNFKVDGNFDHAQYCRCLIETALGLPVSQFPSFLDYQCGQLELPYRWLVQFGTLLNKNYNHELMVPYQKQLNLMIDLLEEKRNQYTGNFFEKELIFKSAFQKNRDERFDIVKVKEALNSKATFNAKKFFLLRRKTDYLQEVDDNEEAPFINCIEMELSFLEATHDLQEKGSADNNNDSEVKQIVFKGTPSQLADLIWQIKGLRNKDGDLLFEGSTSTYARFISLNFCQGDGRSFIESSIRKLLTNYNNGKRTLKKNRIDSSKIRVAED